MPQAKAREIQKATPRDVPVPACLDAEHALVIKIRQLPAERQAELGEIVEDMLDEEEDKRDIRARRNLVRRARAQQDAEV